LTLAQEERACAPGRAGRRVDEHQVSIAALRAVASLGILPCRDRIRESPRTAIAACMGAPMKNLKTLAAVAVACTALLGGAASAGPHDTFTISRVDGPPWGEHGFGGIAMNDSGAVVAGLILPDDIDWYTGPNGKGVTYAPPALAGLRIDWLTGINDAGQVTGVFSGGTGFLGGHAFVTNADGSSYVDLNPPGAAQSRAAAVDDQGHVVGGYQTVQGGQYHGFRTDDNGALVQLGTLVPGGDTAPLAIRGGIVVGAATVAPQVSHAFRTAADGHSLVDLGTFGGQASEARAVNDAGVIVGYAEDKAGVSHAFITRADGSLRQLDADGTFLSSEAWGIDAQGHVVGSGTLAATHESVAFVTGRNGGTMHDLNKLTRAPRGSRLDRGVVINAAGQILANDNYDEHGPWLLTPSASAWRRIDAR
jgi:probable HAF family extracellular repeat protein